MREAISVTAERGLGDEDYKHTVRAEPHRALSIDEDSAGTEGEYRRVCVSCRIQKHRN